MAKRLHTITAGVWAGALVVALASCGGGSGDSAAGSSRSTTSTSDVGRATTTASTVPPTPTTSLDATRTTWQGTLQSADGLQYSFTYTADGAAKPTSQASRSASPCSADPERDAVLSASLTLTNQSTFGGTLKLDFYGATPAGEMLDNEEYRGQDQDRLGLSSDQTIQAAAAYGAAPQCIDLVPAGYTRPHLGLQDSVAPGGSTHVNVVYVFHDYFSPSHPQGDP